MPISTPARAAPVPARPERGATAGSRWSCHFISCGPWPPPPHLVAPPRSSPGPSARSLARLLAQLAHALAYSHARADSSISTEPTTSWCSATADQGARLRPRRPARGRRRSADAEPSRWAPRTAWPPVSEGPRAPITGPILVFSFGGHGLRAAHRGAPVVRLPAFAPRPWPGCALDSLVDSLPSRRIPAGGARPALSIAGQNRAVVHSPGSLLRSSCAPHQAPASPAPTPSRCVSWLGIGSVSSGLLAIAGLRWRRHAPCFPSPPRLWWSTRRDRSPQWPSFPRGCFKTAAATFA